MIVDCEAHVFERCWPIEAGKFLKRFSRIYRFTWHGHDGDLFVDEMNRAGVGKAFLISYDAEDIAWTLEHQGASVEDFWGGKNYTVNAARKFPDRFYWFTTLKDPRVEKNLAVLQQDFEDGAKGVKFFPEYIHCNVDDPAMMKVYETCQSRSAPMLISVEDIYPPQQDDKRNAYFRQLDGIAAKFPKLNISLNHAGMVDILTDQSKVMVEVVSQHPNLHVNTPFGFSHEYPFEALLRRVEKLVELLGAQKVLWATDWPWCETQCKYFQTVTAFQNHSWLSKSDLALVLGENAERIMANSD